MIEKVELFKKYRKVYYDDGTTRDFPIFDFVAETDEDMKAFKEQRAFVRTNTGTDFVYRNTSYAIEKDRAVFNASIQNHLDTKAKEFRYDNIMSARSYAGYDNPFQAEAQTLAVWAADCWVKAGEIEADVEAGNREMPTTEEVLAELPVYGE